MRLSWLPIDACVQGSATHASAALCCCARSSSLGQQGACRLHSRCWVAASPAPSSSQVLSHKRVVVLQPSSEAAVPHCAPHCSLAIDLQVLSHEWVVSRGGILPRPLGADVVLGARTVASIRRLRNLCGGVVTFNRVAATAGGTGASKRAGRPGLQAPADSAKDSYLRRLRQSQRWVAVVGWRGGGGLVVHPPTCVGVSAMQCDLCCRCRFATAAVACAQPLDRIPFISLFAGWSRARAAAA